MSILLSFSRYIPWVSCLIAAVFFLNSYKILSFLFFLFFILGLQDIFQTKRAVRKNYPLTGRIRYLLEYVRPEIRQYFLEDDEEKLPFSRHQRTLVYARSKRENDKRGFGTVVDVNSTTNGWLAHSIKPVKVNPFTLRTKVGNNSCKQPYSLSVLNISAMSFGSLSANAIKSLNRAAFLGSFAQDTGEGGVTKYHTENNGDLIWEIGSGYFGCRDEGGNFDSKKFKKISSNKQIKMIEIKLSQGAKPGHGGILPAAKVNKEISISRGVPIYKDCISPPTHSAFNTPLELIKFINHLKELSNNKPVGIKLCIGQPWEWFSIAKAMLNMQSYPDFIVVDGAEGGTGAAPIEFADHVGLPLKDGLRLVHNTLVGIGARDKIKIGASGKVISAYDIAHNLAIGADWCNAARAFMFSLGCIQSRSCHTDKCPTGVATQNSIRQRALDVKDKTERVKNFHEDTVLHLAELMGAAGLEYLDQITSDLIMIRNSKGELVSLTTMLPRMEKGVLKDNSELINLPEPFNNYWEKASVDKFDVVI